MLKQVTIQDLELLYHIETTCFPIQEAASYQSLKERLTVYHEGFEIFYIDSIYWHNNLTLFLDIFLFITLYKILIILFPLIAPLLLHQVFLQFCISLLR